MGRRTVRANSATRPQINGKMMLLGELTEGPFLDANKEIGYAINGTVLMRLAPVQGGKQWTAKPPIQLDGKRIAGHWQLLGKYFYVTQRDGQFRAFNEESGEPIGAAIRLSAQRRASCRRRADRRRQADCSAF